MSGRLAGRVALFFHITVDEPSTGRHCGTNEYVYLSKDRHYSMKLTFCVKFQCRKNHKPTVSLQRSEVVCKDDEIPNSTQYHTDNSVWTQPNHRRHTAYVFRSINPDRIQTSYFYCNLLFVTYYVFFVVYRLHPSIR